MNTDSVARRKILHMDMDSFYASVEILDNPKLEGLPVVVGGSPNSRAVVCAASYKAREYGVRSAIACSVAKRLCPDAIFLPPRFSRYREISREIHRIFQQYTSMVEPLSLDEAWLDVTTNDQNIPSATWVAQKIKAQIKEELNLTCSAGVSYNKFLAKIASDEDKPDGLFVVTPQEAHRFLQNMEVKKIPGVGKVTQEKLAKLGIFLGAELHQKEERFLVEKFGKMGHYLYQIIRGIDLRPVITHHERKSASVETTFAEDFLYGPKLVQSLDGLVKDLFHRFNVKENPGKTLNLKIKFFDFQTVTRSMTQETAYQAEEEVSSIAQAKLMQVCKESYPQKKIRLLGIGISNFLDPEKENRGSLQLDFFDLLPPPSQIAAPPKLVTKIE